MACCLRLSDRRSTVPMHKAPRLFIARHGETVFNAAARLQGDHAHTPLTRAGFEQVDEMGAVLHHHLGPRPGLALWSSSAGRALQTLAIIAEHLGLDWHDAHHDDRLVEIGMGSWGGRYYADVIAEQGPVVDPENRLLKPAPDGESYAEIASRVTQWFDEHGQTGRDKLVIMHGISSRVLRGVLLGLDPLPGYDAPVAPGLPQGSVVMIENGVETLVVEGTGGERA
jgi:broad specificity phosphatase PhoE